jgi:hypothetical protein
MGWYGIMENKYKYQDGCLKIQTFIVYDEEDKMKKTHRYNQLSDKICARKNCQRRIKERLKDKYDICYHCYCEQENAKGHLMQDARPKAERFPTAKRMRPAI